MTGGSLHWIWKPYELYEVVDHVRVTCDGMTPFKLIISHSQVYGWKSYEEGDGFTNAQCTPEAVCRTVAIRSYPVPPSCSEHHRKSVEYNVSVARTCFWIPSSAFDRLCLCNHDIVKDHLVLATGVFLRWMLRRSQ